MLLSTFCIASVSCCKLFVARAPVSLRRSALFPACARASCRKIPRPDFYGRDSLGIYPGRVKLDTFVRNLFLNISRAPACAPTYRERDLESTGAYLQQARTGQTNKWLTTDLV